MKTVAMLSAKLKRNYLLSLLFILVVLVGRCDAHNHLLAVNVSIPTVIFCVAITLICACFFICCCRMLVERRHYRILPPSAVQYSHHSHETSYYGGTQPYLAQRYIPPSTSSSPPLPRLPYPYTQRSITPSPPPSGATTSQTVPQAYEPVSLPEATLHQGEAPPAYEEAIKMPKTTDTVDQDQ